MGTPSGGYPRHGGPSVGIPQLSVHLWTFPEWVFPVGGPKVGVPRGQSRLGTPCPGLPLPAGGTPPLGPSRSYTATPAFLPPAPAHGVEVRQNPRGFSSLVGGCTLTTPFSCVGFFGGGSRGRVTAPKQRLSREGKHCRCARELSPPLPDSRCLSGSFFLPIP